MNKTNHMAIARNSLVDVFEDTRKQSLTKYSKETKLTQNLTFVYDLLKRPMACGDHGTAVDMIKDGTVSAGYKFANNYRTAILNFADALVPGGLVLVGETTQEENICRCSNLYESITMDNCMRDYYKANAKKSSSGVYLDRIIYSPDVLVFKDDVSYTNINPRTLDVITCPAPSAQFKNAESAFDVYKKRITNIVTSAIVNGVECLVLGAWGCGAFRQNPYLVAQAFVDVLNSYSGKFEKVVFAFRPTPTPIAEIDASDSTTIIFVDEFEKRYKWGVYDGIR